jgi:hypothetical protein
MSTPEPGHGPGSQPTPDTGVAPLGGETTEPVADDGPDGMAGPVYPPEETEPDAQR